MLKGIYGFSAPLRQVLLDFVIQSVSRGVMSSSSLIDDSLQRVRAILGPQDAKPRAWPRVTKDFITQNLVLIYAITDRHAETKQHNADKALHLSISYCPSISDMTYPPVLVPAP